MAGFNGTTFAKYLKTRYSKNFVESMTYRNRPLFAMLKKFEDMGGDSWAQPVLFEDPASRSATFATAQTLAASKSTQIERFLVTRVSDYGVVTLDNQTILASKGNENAFREMVTTAIDGIMRSTTESACISLFRKGWGSVGQVSNPGASTTLTLTKAADVVNFKKGDVLQFSASEDAAVLLDAGDELTVNGVDRNAGTLTMSGNVTNIAAIANNAFIFKKGDRQDSATPTRLKIAGLGDWCPSSAPSATTFFGVDRTADTRLGGCRVDGSSLLLEEALVEAAVLVNREGGTPDVVFMNPTQYGKLINSLGSKVQYVDVTASSNAGIAFRGVELYTPAGTVRVVADRFCPVDTAYMLQMDTWMLGSLGGVPRILNMDGLESLRQASEDGIEIRVGYYGNLICKAPGWNCAIHSLPTA